MLDVGAAVVDAHVLTVESPDDSRVDYQLEVAANLLKSTANGATINGGDTVQGHVASGYVIWGRDGYTFTGDLVRFAADGDLTVSLDGELVDPSDLVTEHTLTVESPDDSRVDYQLEAGSGLEKSRALNASHDSGDTVDGNVASGYVIWGRDSFTYAGELLAFDADGDLVGYLHGREMDPNSR